MRRLIWDFAGSTYHIVGNLMSRLNYDETHNCHFSWKDGIYCQFCLRSCGRVTCYQQNYPALQEYFHYTEQPAPLYWQLNVFRLVAHIARESNLYYYWQVPNVQIGQISNYDNVVVFASAMNMIRKYHKHTPQANPWRRKEKHRTLAVAKHQEDTLTRHQEDS